MKDFPVVIEPQKVEKGGRKAIIISVSVVVTVAIIISGMVSAFYFMHETTKDALEVKTRSFEYEGKRYDEVAELFSDNVSKYTLKGEKEAYEVVLDPNRKILTIKSEIDQICVSIPQWDTFEPEQLTTSEMAEMGQITNETLSIRVSRGKTLIREHQILGDEGKQMCQGFPLYWGTVMPHPAENGRRFKRWKFTYRRRFRLFGITIWSREYEIEIE